MAGQRKTGAVGTLWRSEAEKQAWYAGMAEAERREANGESWDSALGRWITRKAVQRPDGTRRLVRSHPSRDQVERERVARYKAEGRVYDRKTRRWITPSVKPT